MYCRKSCCRENAANILHVLKVYTVHAETLLSNNVGKKGLFITSDQWTKGLLSLFVLLIKFTVSQWKLQKLKQAVCVFIAACSYRGRRHSVYTRVSGAYIALRRSNHSYISFGFWNTLQNSNKSTNIIHGASFSTFYASQTFQFKRNSGDNTRIFEQNGRTTTVLFQYSFN